MGGFFVFLCVYFSFVSYCCLPIILKQSGIFISTHSVDFFFSFLDLEMVEMKFSVNLQFLKYSE